MNLGASSYHDNDNFGGHQPGNLGGRHYASPSSEELTVPRESWPALPDSSALDFDFEQFDSLKFQDYSLSQDPFFTGTFSPPPPQKQKQKQQTSATASRGPASSQQKAPSTPPSESHDPNPPSLTESLSPCCSSADASLASTPYCLSGNHDLTSQSIDPSELSGNPSQPRDVIIGIRGDVGEYLQKRDKKGQEVITPTVAPRATKVFDSVSIVDGGNLELPMGFTTDYYGLSEEPRGTKRRYGEGVGWRSQEAEGEERVYDETIQFTCQVCGLKWKGDLAADKMFRDSATARAGINRFLRPEHHPQSGLSFSRLNVTAVHWYLEREEGDEPCVRGVTIDGSPHPECRMTTRCCPPPGSEDTLLKSIQKCLFDDCRYRTTSVAEMRKHLMKHHLDYMSGLISRCRDERPLSDCDRAVASRAMRIFHDRDAGNKLGVSDPRRTVLSPDEIESPAWLDQHRQWVEYLSPTPKQYHEVIFHDLETWLWLRRLYDLDNDPAVASKQCYEQVWFDQVNGAITYSPEVWLKERKLWQQKEAKRQRRRRG